MQKEKKQKQAVRVILTAECIPYQSDMATHVIHICRVNVELVQARIDTLTIIDDE